jgi:Tol biopolymer transport system component
LALTPSSEIRITRLTSTPQRETMPHIAADGRRYVYTANDAVELQLDLFIAATAGGDPLRLTHTPEDEVDPRLSPSGDWVLFARERGERRGVWRLPAFGGAERLVAVGGWSPAWSPDGVAVVFVRTGGRGRSDLVHVELQGTGGERTLVAGAVEIASPAFAPDGSQVAYVSSNAAWVVPTEGGTPRRLGAAADYLRSVSWDPAGGALLTDGVWGGLAGGLWRLRLDRNSPDVLAAVGAGAFDPSVAADGRRLLYAREHKVQELWRFDAAGRRGERLEVPITLDCFDVDAAGRRVAYFDYDPPPGRATLGLVDLESGERRDLGDALCPAFSPDGSRLAFLGWRQGDDGLFVLDLRSDELRTVARNESRGKHDEADLLRRPAWSPDGRWIAFDARLPIGGGLRLARSDGSSERSLGGRLVGLPAWSGDGRQILSCHLATAPGALVAIDVASASEGVLHEGRVLREGCAHRALPSALPSGGIALLTEARRPRVLVLDQEGRESAPTVELRLEQDPSVWGVYGLRPVPGGWIAHLERYESDLFLIEAL